MSAAKRKVGRAEDALGVIKIPVKLQAPEVDIAKVKDSHKNAGWYPRQESNLHLSFRKALFYPLNYQGVECWDYGAKLDMDVSGDKLSIHLQSV